MLLHRIEHPEDGCGPFRGIKHMDVPRDVLDRFVSLIKPEGDGADDESAPGPWQEVDRWKAKNAKAKLWAYNQFMKTKDPTDYDDGYRHPRDLIFGFVPTQHDIWFPPAACKLLAPYGYKKALYTIKKRDVLFFDMQCAFVREDGGTPKYLEMCDNA